MLGESLLFVLQIGASDNAEVELVDTIPQEASGKYRFCISKVAREHLQAMSV